MALHGHTFGHWLQISVKQVVAVLAKVVLVLHFLLEIITTVNREIMLPVIRVISCIHVNDPLWDGQQCQSEGTCCSTAPWFTVDLAIPTTDSIEVHICADSTPTEDTPINLLELYVQ